VSHVRLRSPFPPVLAEALFLAFVLEKAAKKKAADHEAVVALAQVASRSRWRIKKCEAGGRTHQNAQ
jgi:hypothetical protein